jgi:hypothetical protein
VTNEIISDGVTAAKKMLSATDVESACNECLTPLLPPVLELSTITKP